MRSGSALEHHCAPLNVFKADSDAFEAPRERALVERKNRSRKGIGGLTTVLLDVSRQAAARLYRQNWDGCAALWIQSYRLKRARRLSHGAKP